MILRCNIKLVSSSGERLIPPAYPGLFFRDCGTRGEREKEGKKETLTNSAFSHLYLLRTFFFSRKGKKVQQMKPAQHALALSVVGLCGTGGLS